MNTCWSEYKPKNSITHLGGESQDFASSAHETDDGTVRPLRRVVFVLLWCIHQGFHTLIIRPKRYFDGCFHWNSGKINPKVRVSVLQNLILFETFRSIFQIWVVNSIEKRRCLRLWGGVKQPLLKLPLVENK